MSIQDEANKLIEQAQAEQKRVEDLTNSIVGSKQGNLDAIIRKAEEQKAQIVEQANNIVGNKQEDLDALIREKEEEKTRIIEQASSISSQKQQEMNAFIKKQTENYTAEEIAYMNSIYYQNYKMAINNINNMDVTQVATYLNQKYYDNQMRFKDPFYDGLAYAFNLNGIGFPVPDRFIKELEKVVDSKMKPFVQVPNTEFKTKIEPLMYVGKSENYAKRIEGYLIKVSLTNEKINIETKTK